MEENYGKQNFFTDGDELLRLFINQLDKSPILMFRQKNEINSYIALNSQLERVETPRPSLLFKDYKAVLVNKTKESDLFLKILKMVSYTAIKEAGLYYLNPNYYYIYEVKDKIKFFNINKRQTGNLNKKIAIQIKVCEI